MAKIIPFPRPDPDEPLGNMSILATGVSIYDLNDCTDTVHFFADPSGTCKCGKERWPPEEDEAS